jgi:hypothetical protein
MSTTENPTTVTSNQQGIPALTANGTNGADAINASSDAGTGVTGKGRIFGVFGIVPSTGSTPAGTGVMGTSDDGIGVWGSSTNSTGVLAASTNWFALAVIGRIAVHGDLVGEVTLPAGATTVTVKSTAAGMQSLILLTPLGNPNGQLWVTRAQGSFTINASAAPTSDLSIAYLIITMFHQEPGAQSQPQPASLHRQS